MFFSRISFQMVASGSVFNHPATQERDYILRKLITLHNQHQTPALQAQRDLQRTGRQLRAGECAAEA